MDYGLRGWMTKLKMIQAMVVRVRITNIKRCKRKAQAATMDEALTFAMTRGALQEYANNPLFTATPPSYYPSIRVVYHDLASILAVQNQLMIPPSILPVHLVYYPN